MKARRVLSRVLPALALLAALFAASAAFGATLPMNVLAHGKKFAVPASLVATSSDTSGVVSSYVDTASVTSWIWAVAGTPGVDHKVVNWHSTVDKKHRRLNFTHNDGYKIDQPKSVTALCSALWSHISTPTATTITLPNVALPKPKKLGKQILVVQSLRQIYLYDNNKVIKKYRCAVGMKAYPTLNGTFHIGKKVKNPTWTNGYADWSKNMPAYIGPGPNNPLGTRAMYVYTGLTGGHDTGERFHGVPPSEDSSIGHAASHGCFRMHRKDVEDFFKRVTVGTPVYVIP